MEKIGFVTGWFNCLNCGIYNIHPYLVNKSSEQIKKAFKDSIILTGIDFTKICNNHSDNTISESHIEKLKDFGIDITDYLDFNGHSRYIVSADYFIDIILKFIGLSLEGFSFEEALHKRSEFDNMPLIDLSVGWGFYFT